MRLEPDLTSKGPDSFDPYVLREGAEVGVGGRGQVLEDGELVADAVGGEVGHRGQGSFLVFEYHGADKFGLEFDNNSGGGCVFFGWNGEGIGYQEVGGHGGHVGNVPGGAGGRKGGGEDLLVNSADDG